MPERRTVRLLREGYPDRGPAFDTAVSHALLRRVSAAEEPETLRVHRPGPVVAFGPVDRLAPRFGEAVAAAQAHGFGSVLRLAGGRAAVFHEQTLAFAWIVPDRTPRLGIIRRFEETAGIMAGALRSLGVDARVGRVPGEYCPGDHSVNARGRTKLVGVGQRVLSGAAHVGGVVVVGGSARIRDVLTPVNEALGLEWDPEAVGSLQGEVATITWDAAERAILDRFAEAHDLVEGATGEASLALAQELLPRHVPSV